MYILAISLSWIMDFITIKSQKPEPLKRHLFIFKAVNVMLFISDTQYFVYLNLCNTTPKHVKLRKKCIM